ncbi:hypothetical protein HDU93_002668, partial [Gonapodya sp. JEL0774]
PELTPLDSEKKELAKVLHTAEETLRRLKFLRKQTETGESETIANLISKWRDTCQQAARDYRTKMMDNRSSSAVDRGGTGFEQFTKLHGGSAWDLDIPPWEKPSWGWDDSGSSESPGRGDEADGEDRFGERSKPGTETVDHFSLKMILARMGMPLERAVELLGFNEAEDDFL